MAQAVSERMKRYLYRGQLREVYAVNPDPRKEGRSVGFVVASSQASPFRPNATGRNGWKLVECSPSTSLYR